MLPLSLQLALQIPTIIILLRELLLGGSQLDSKFFPVYLELSATGNQPCPFLLPFELSNTMTLSLRNARMVLFGKKRLQLFHTIHIAVILIFLLRICQPLLKLAKHLL